MAEALQIIVSWLESLSLPELAGVFSALVIFALLAADKLDRRGAR